MTIKEIEERTGLERANIRFYEKEGLLMPDRLENGYRSYTEKDVQTLLRIKLLRSLQLSLEDIRALQKGEKQLSEALSAHLHALEKEKQALAAAEDVCRMMETDNARFETLNAEKYLNQLNRSPSETPAAPPETDAYHPPMHPWRRYFARTLDYNLYLLPIELFILLVCHVNPNTQLGRALALLSPTGAFLLMLLIEPFLLHHFGTTPGKRLFGLRVTQANDVLFSLQNARRRTWEVLWRGYALGIPVLNIIRLWNCYKLCKAGQEQDWDEAPRSRLYVIRDTKPWRGAVYVGLATLLFVTNLWAQEMSALPPNRGDLTVAEFAENYNFVCIYEYGAYPRFVLDHNGNWVDLQPKQHQSHYYYPGGDTMKFYSTEAFGPPGFESTMLEKPAKLEFETDADGNITRITMYKRRSLILDMLGAEDFYLLATAFVQAQPDSVPFSGTRRTLASQLDRMFSDVHFVCSGITVDHDVEPVGTESITYTFSMTKDPQT